MCVTTINGDVIINDQQNVLIQKKNGSGLIYVPLTQDIISRFNLNVDTFPTEVPDLDSEPEHEISDANNSKETDHESKLSSRKATLFLIDLVRQNQKNFEKGLKKIVWQRIAQECCVHFKSVTSAQCDTK